MLRLLLIIFGFLLIGIHQFTQLVTTQVQFYIFIIGIVLLGIPHGAADLLIAIRTAENDKKSFSKILFLLNYLGRIIIFGIVLWKFTVLGNLLFIIFAAYHFGETDLYLFKTNTFTGKLFVISYGLLILGVILLHHYNEVTPLLLEFTSGKSNSVVLSWIALNQYLLLLIVAVFFLVTAIVHFSLHKEKQLQNKREIIIYLALNLFILFKLPLILGFTFYFVTWHSLLSLKNIVTFLGKSSRFSMLQIFKQIALYSFLAMVGMIIFGFVGYMYLNNSTITMYVFLSLAVLTAPHMQIMHDMYKHIRSSNLKVAVS